MNATSFLAAYSALLSKYTALILKAYGPLYVRKTPAPANVWADHVVHAVDSTCLSASASLPDRIKIFDNTTRLNVCFTCNAEVGLDFRGVGTFDIFHNFEDSLRVNLPAATKPSGETRNRQFTCSLSTSLLVELAVLEQSMLQEIPQSSRNEFSEFITAMSQLLRSVFTVDEPTFPASEAVVHVLINMPEWYEERDKTGFGDFASFVDGSYRGVYLARVPVSIMQSWAGIPGLTSSTDPVDLSCIDTTLALRSDGVGFYDALQTALALQK